MGKIEGWRRSRHYARPTTKMAWESIGGNVISIDYVSSSNIPYKIILNDITRINSSGDLVGMDSRGTFKRAKESAIYYMRSHPRG